MAVSNSKWTYNSGYEFVNGLYYDFETQIVNMSDKAHTSSPCWFTKGRG
jgi:hypothetical protein